MYGYAGKVLDINLTGRQVTVNDLKADWARDYLGGKGLGFRYLFESLGPYVNPLAPENVLIFMTSPLTGTIMSSTGK